jgi:hypothetical protein
MVAVMDTSRREQIRTGVATQRSAAQRLRNQIADATVRQQLDPIFRDLDDVLVFVDDPKDRTPAEEARWLDFADVALKGAVEKLQIVTETVQKYGGPDKIQTS